MIDGFKILYNNRADWSKSYLDFSEVNSTQNPTKKPFKYCKYKGLFLSITETENHQYKNVRGSLPNYYNNDKGNAFDFGFNELISSVNQLQNDLEINPELSHLQGFEFGVNIKLPFAVKNVLDACKSYKGKPFAVNYGTDKNPFRGVTVDLQQYQIKIYDKSLQTGNINDNICRFEIKVKKMIWIKNQNLNIKTLADLQLKTVWTELSKILLETWQNIVFVDNHLNYKEMKPIEQKKYLRFLDVNYWDNLNRNQLYKARKYLKGLQLKYSNVDLQSLCYNLIDSKCNFLATEKGDKLTTFSQPQKPTKWRQINHYDKGVNNRLKKELEVLIKQTSSIKSKQKIIVTKKLNKCVCCGTSLKDKKVTAKYCSTKCKNKINGINRTTKNRLRINEEIKGLIKILPKIHKIELKQISISSKTGVIKKGISIYNLPEIITKDISKINLFFESLDYVFTTVRAKKLFKQLLKINNL